MLSEEIKQKMALYFRNLAQQAEEKDADLAPAGPKEILAQHFVVGILSAALLEKQRENNEFCCYEGFGEAVGEDAETFDSVPAVPAVPAVTDVFITQEASNEQDDEPCFYEGLGQASENDADTCGTLPAQQASDEQVKQNIDAHFNRTQQAADPEATIPKEAPSQRIVTSIGSLALFKKQAERNTISSHEGLGQATEENANPAPAIQSKPTPFKPSTSNFSQNNPNSSLFYSPTTRNRPTGERADDLFQLQLSCAGVNLESATPGDGIEKISWRIVCTGFRNRNSSLRDMHRRSSRRSFRRRSWRRNWPRSRFYLGRQAGETFRELFHVKENAEEILKKAISEKDRKRRGNWFEMKERFLAMVDATAS